MKKWILMAAAVSAMLGSGCAQKQLVINGMICPAGVNEDKARADFAECRVYDLEAATKASRAPMTIECQKCLEGKGYKVEQ